MPKCDECQYLTYDGYEYKEYYCKIFGYDIPEKYKTKYDYGCKCTQKFLKKLSDEEDKANAEYWKRYEDSYVKWGKLIDLEVLKNDNNL